MRPRSIIVAIIATVATGCGAVIDGTYLIGGGRTGSSATESSPTAQSIERPEYAGRLDPDGAVALECYRRTRAVERTWEVHRTYKRQGSYDRGAYTAAIVADVLIGGVIAGVIAGQCLKGDSDLSCNHIAWASPFAVDVVYSLIRGATAKPKILVDRWEGATSLRLAPTPTADRSVDCGLDSVWVGEAQGPTDVDALRGDDHGQTRTLREGALALQVIDGAVELSPPAASRLLSSRQARMWALDARGVPREIEIDRCETLRRHAGALPADQLAELDSQCPVDKQR